MHSKVQTPSIIFGKFVIPESRPLPKQSLAKFIGHIFRDRYWKSLSEVTLDSILDLRQGGYTDADIMASLDLQSIPPSSVIYDLIGRCSTCYRRGHKHSSCPGILCQVCINIGHACDKCFHDTYNDDYTQRNKFARKIWVPKKVQKLCSLCLRNGHVRSNCTTGLRCNICDLLGHFSFSCTKKSTQKKCWVIKHTNGPTVAPPKVQKSNRHNTKMIWVIKKKSELPRYEGPSMMDGVVPDNNITNNAMDLWVTHATEVEQAAHATTGGGNDSQFLFTRASGTVSEAETSPMAAYLYFMKYYIYKKCLPALTGKSTAASEDQGDLSLIVNANLHSFFMSYAPCSVPPVYWVNERATTISKRT